MLLKVWNKSGSWVFFMPTFSKRQPVTCSGCAHLSSACPLNLQRAVIQSCFCLSPCSCSHSSPLHLSLFAHRVLHRRARSVPTVTSLPILLQRARLTNIPPQKCHLTAFERQRQWIKSQEFCQFYQAKFKICFWSDYKELSSIYETMSWFSGGYKIPVTANKTLN